MAGNGEDTAWRSKVAPTWSAACRPTLLFVATYMLTTTSHEAVHAAIAYLLGFPSTLFQLWVNLDTANATRREQAVIATAGPCFCLCVGIACGMAYRAFRQRPAGLVFLMLAISAVYTFLGNLFGAALGGDIRRALSLLGAPAGIRYAVSATGFALLAVYMFRMGRELLSWAPSGSGLAKAVVSVTVAPWLIGGSLVILFYWPLPPSLVAPTLVGSAFWIFAVAGACLGRTARTIGSLASGIQAADLVISAVTLVLVRFLVGGVRLVP